MGILDLLIVSSVSVLKVLIMTSVGSLLATDHVNILGEDARKHLNNVSCSVIYELRHLSNVYNSKQHPHRTPSPHTHTFFVHSACANVN